MDFSLSEEQKMIQQTVRRFVDRELMPLESEVLQSEGKYPTGIEPELYHTLQVKAQDLGFFACSSLRRRGERMKRNHFLLMASVFQLALFVPLALWARKHPHPPPMLRSHISYKRTNLHSCAVLCWCSIRLPAQLFS